MNNIDYGTCILGRGKDLARQGRDDMELLEVDFDVVSSPARRFCS